jgi:hypothetical protein
MREDRARSLAGENAACVIEYFSRPMLQQNRRVQHCRGRELLASHTRKSQKLCCEDKIFALALLRGDFGTTTECMRNIIFFLTSFFNDSIHQLVATKYRCKFFHEEWKGE